PQEWLSTRELERQKGTLDALGLMSRAGMNDAGAVNYLSSLVEAAPIELDQVSGRFEFTQDGIGISGMKGRIENNELNIDGEIKGKGVAGGPNENVLVTVNGIIGPIPGEPAVDVTVSADHVKSEPALTRAFPSEVHEAFHFLDADGKGLLPTFTGSFICKVR